MLAEHVITFGNEFNKLNKSQAGILDSIYHMRFKLFRYRDFGVKTSRF